MLGSFIVRVLAGCRQIIYEFIKLSTNYVILERRAAVDLEMCMKLHMCMKVTIFQYSSVLQEDADYKLNSIQVQCVGLLSPEIFQNLNRAFHSARDSGQHTQISPPLIDLASELVGLLVHIQKYHSQEGRFF